jgi:hypothetical protein
MEGELDYRAKPVLKTESTSKRYGESALRLPPFHRVEVEEVETPSLGLGN